MEETDDLLDKIVGIGSTTGRKTYYPELRKRLSELEQFKTLIDASGEMIILVELPAKVIKDCNRAVVEKLDYSKDYLISASIDEIIADCNGDSLFTENVSGLRCTFKTGSSDMLYVELNITVVKFDMCDYAVIVASDISKRLDYENRILNSERKFHAVFDNFFQMTTILNKSGEIIDVNQTALKLIGAEINDVRGVKLWDSPWFNHCDDEKIKLKDAVFSASSGKSVRYEANHIDLEGRLLYIDFSLKPVTDSTGDIIYIISEGRDVTSNRIISRELEKAKKLLDNILESMDSGIVTLDENNVVIHLNRYAEKIFSTTKEEVIGDNVNNLMYNSGFIEIEKMIAKLNSNAVSNSLILPKKNSRGVSYYEFILYPLKRYNENGIVLRIDDVTERVKFTDLMIQSEKMLTVGGLASGMAHEINNPLSIINGSIQNIMRRLSPDLPANLTAAGGIGVELEKVCRYLEDRKVFSYIDSVKEAASRASRIVSDMLIFSRGNSGVKEICDLRDIAEKSVNILNCDTFYKGVIRNNEIKISIIGERVRAFVCYTEIEQVIINLLKNSIDSLQTDGVNSGNIDLILGHSSDNLSAEIIVSDNGRGIASGIIKKVFEPFFTTKSPGSGTGLGLSIVYYIVKEKHNGSVTVSSEEGSGCKVIVTLPFS